MLKRFKDTFGGIAGALGGGVLAYFFFVAFGVAKSTAFFVSVALQGYVVPLICVIAFVAIRPAGHGEIAEDEAGDRRHFAIARAGYTLSILPYVVAVASLREGRMGLAAVSLGVYVLMAILPLRNFMRVRRTLEYRARQS